jgi:DNA adenine methylase
MHSSVLPAIAPLVEPRPFLKWAGGKHHLIPQYSPYFPAQGAYDTYCEPFLGGGAIFFHLRPKQAVLMDINPELVNVYQQVQKNVGDLIELLREHRDRHSSEHYYHVRACIPVHPTERAARLIYLNKTCFNGLYRENSKGQFNVPMGRYKNPGIFDVALLRAASKSLQVAVIKVAPFEEILTIACSDRDFVYFDPPYHPISSTSNFTGYNRFAFTSADHTRLRDVFAELCDRGVHTLLSNSNCDFVQALYKTFKIENILATRSINSKAQRRGKITELLIMPKQE